MPPPPPQGMAQGLPTGSGGNTYANGMDLANISFMQQVTAAAVAAASSSSSCSQNPRAGAGTALEAGPGAGASVSMIGEQVVVRSVSSDDDGCGGGSGLSGNVCRTV